MHYIEESGEVNPELFNEILSKRKMDTRSEAQIKQDVHEDLEWLKNAPFNTDTPNKKYTEGEMKMALAYQKAESYQIVANFLINDRPKIKQALDYLYNDKILFIDQLDKMLNDLGTNE